jgi:hypothetical protein
MDTFAREATMVKVEFKTFQEAAAFSNNLSLTIKSATSIYRDGELWCVDVPRVEQTDTGQTALSGTAHSTADTSKQYDSDGYDEGGYNRDGYDREGYDRYGFDRTGRLRPFL